MSRTLSESLIIEGIKALREQSDYLSDFVNKRGGLPPENRASVSNWEWDRYTAMDRGKGLEWEPSIDNVTLTTTPRLEVDHSLNYKDMGFGRSPSTTRILHQYLPKRPGVSLERDDPDAAKLLGKKLNDNIFKKMFNTAKIPPRDPSSPPQIKINYLGLDRDPEILTGSPRSLESGPFSRGMSDARNSQANFGTRPKADAFFRNLRDRALHASDYGRAGTAGRKVSGK